MSSKVIDERVVEMRFDNKQFESGVSSTLKMLERLDESLKLTQAIDGIANVAKAIGNVSFEGMAKGIDALNQKFTTMGVAGMAVVQRITNALIDSGKQLYNNTIGQIKTGGMNRAMNIEQAKFQLKGLKIAWEDVYDSINNAVAGTAYGLDSAAKASAQLAASNVALGDDMSVALRAISGVAAMTNSSYDEIAHIFTTIAGNGRVMTEQLNQFAGRGLNVAAELAKSFGVTEGELRTMVSKGEVDFGRFAKAMYDAFGEHAAKANETYAGSLSNVKAALSKIGAEFAAPYMDSMGDIFRALIPVLNGVRPLMKPIFDDASEFMHAVATFIAKSLENFNYEPIQQVINLVHQAYLAVKPIGAVLADIGSALVRVWNSFKLPGTKFKEWLQLDKILEKVNGALTPMQKVYKAVGEPFTKTFGVVKGAVDSVLSPIKTVTGAVKGVSTGVKEVGDAIETTTDYAKKIEETAMEVVRGGKFANNIEERRKEIEGLGLSFELVQNRVNEYFGNAYRYEVKQEDLAKMTGEVTDENNKLADSMGNVSALSQKAEVIFRGVGAAISIVAKFAGAVLVGISPLIGVLARAGVEIVNFVSFMGIYVQSLEKAMDRSGWFATIADVISSVMEHLIRVLGPPISLFLDFQRSIFETGLSMIMLVANYKEYSKTNENVARAVKAITTIFTKLRNIYIGISYAITSFIDKIRKSEAFTRFVENFKALGESLKKLGVEVILRTWEKIASIKFKVPKIDKDGKIYAAVTKVLNGLAQAFENAKNWVDNFYAAFKEKGFDAVREQFSGLFSLVDQFAEIGKKAVSAVVGAFEKAKTAVVDFWTRTKKLIDMVKNSEAFSHFAAAIGALWRTLKALGIEAFAKAFEGLVSIVSKFKLPKIGKESKAYEKITGVLEKLTPILWAVNKRLRIFLNDLKEKGIVGAFSHVVDDLKESIKDLFAKLGENKYIKPFFDWIVKAKTAVVDFWTRTKNLIDMVKNSDAFTHFTAALGALWRTLKALGIELVAQAFNSLVNAVSKFKFPKIDKESKAYERVTGVLDKLTSIIWVVNKYLRVFLGYLKDEGIVGAFSHVVDDLKESIKDLFAKLAENKIVKPLLALFGKVSAAVKAAREAVVKFLNSIKVNKSGRTLLDVIKDISKSFKNFVKEFKIDPFGTLKKAFAGLHGQFSRAGDVLKNTKKALIGFLKSIKIGSSGKTLLDWVKKLITNFSQLSKAFKADPLGTLKKSVNMLKKAFTQLRPNGIAKLFDNLVKIDPAKTVSTIFDNLRNAISSFNVGSIVTTVREKIASFFGKAADAGGSATSFVTTFFDSIFSTIRGALNYISKIGGNASIIYLLVSFGRMFSGIGKIGRNLGKVAKNFAKVVKGFTDIGTTVKTVITNIGTSISGVFKSVSGLLTGVKDSIIKVSDAYAKTFKAQAFKDRAKGLFILAAALAVLAGSLWLLAQLDVDGLKRAAIGIGIVTAAIAALILLMTFLQKRKSKNADIFASLSASINKFADTLKGFQDSVNKFLGRTSMAVLLLAFAASVAILVGVIKSLSKIDPGDALIAVPIIIAVMLGLATAAGIASKMGSNKGNIGKAVLVVGFAAAMKLVVSALKDVTKISGKDLVKGVVALGAVMAELVATMFLMSKVAKIDSVLPDILLMVTIVLTMKSMVKILKSLAEMSLGEILKGIVGLAGIIGAIAAVLAVAKVMGKDAKISILTLHSVVIDMVAISIVIKSMANVDLVKLLGASTALSMVVASMALLAKSSTMTFKGMVVLALLTAVVYAIAQILTQLTHLPTNGVLEKAEALSIILLAMSGVCAILATIGRDGALMLHAINGLAGMVLVIAGIGLVFAALGHFLSGTTENGESKYDELQKFLDIGIPIMSKIMKGIGSMIGELAGGFVSGLLDGLGLSLESFATDLSNFMDNLQPFIEKVRGITAEDITSVAYLTGIIALMAANDIITVLTNFLALDDGLPVFGTRLNSFAVNSATFFDMLKDVDESTLTSAKYLSEALLAITAADLLSGIASIIGQGSFDSFGTQLDFIGKGIAFFAARTKHIDTDNVENAANAVKILAELNNELPRTGGALQQFLGEKNMGEFGTRIKTLGEGIRSFSDAVTKDGGVDRKAVESSAAAAGALAELENKLPRTGGILQMWFGEKDLHTFGSRLQLFGSNIKAYSDIITEGEGIDNEAVQNSATSAMALAELNSKLPKTGGVLEEWMGSENLATFGARLQLFGGHLVNYSKTITRNGGIDNDAVTSSANAALALAELQSALPATGGWWQSVMGEKSIGEFGSQLRSFGFGLKRFSDYTKDVDIESISNVSTIYSDILDFANRLSSFDASVLFLDDQSNGTNGINTFLQHFNTIIGDAIQQMTDKFTGTETETGLNEVGSKLAGFIKAGLIAEDSPLMTAMGGVVSDMKLKLTEETTITSWQDAGAGLADAVKTGLTKRAYEAGGVKDRVKDIISNLRSTIVGSPFDTTFKTAGTKLLQYLIAGFNHTKDQVLNKIRLIVAEGQTTIFGSPYNATYKAAGSFLIQYLMQGIGAALPTVLNKFRDVATQGQNTLIGSPFDATFKSAGSIMIYRVVSGVNNAASSLVTACGNAAQSGVNAFGAYVGSFDVAGWNLIMGAITGMNNASVHIFNTAYYIANTVLSIISAVWDEHSPSKEGESRGSYLIQGVTNGVTKAAAGLYNSVDTLADNTLDVMHDAIQRVSDAIESDIDATPVIRPVVDLTGIEDGASAIDGLLGNGSTSSLNAAIGGIGANVSAQAAAMNAANPEDLVPTFYATVPVYLDGKEIGNRTADIAIQRISRTQLSVMRAAGR